MDMPYAIKTALAFLPLVWLLAGLGWLRLEAWKAGLSAAALTAVLAPLIFGMSGPHMLQASAEGAMFALHPIIWVILSAVFVYNVTLNTGGLDDIKKMLSTISGDRRIQALILAFAFGSFLEAVAGFGTAVAIPAGIMVALGFEPVLAATVCLIANTIPVAFGVLGIPIITLAQVTSLPLDRLSLYTAIQLIPFILLLPLVLIYAVTGRIGSVRGVIPVSIVTGAAFALGQTIMAVAAGPELAAVVGALLSLACIIVWVRIFPVRNIWRFKGEAGPDAGDADAGGTGACGANAGDADACNANAGDANAGSADAMGIGKTIGAWSPYILTLAIVLATRFIPALGFFNESPFTLKKQFFFGPGGKPLTFQLATGGGTALFLSAIIGGFIQGATPAIIIKAFLHTVRQLVKTIVTVLSIVVLAKTMGYGGMTSILSKLLSSAGKSIYPVLAPFIGAIGTFLTGSDTSSNVLFGNLHKQAAMQLGLSRDWLVAANASGATAGKMISPQSISIATAASGLSGKEGNILRVTIRYCIIYTALMGLLVFFGTLLHMFQT